jgi:hypothetical protein
MDIPPKMFSLFSSPMAEFIPIMSTIIFTSPVYTCSFIVLLTQLQDTSSLWCNSTCGWCNHRLNRMWCLCFVKACWFWLISLLLLTCFCSVHQNILDQE